MYVTNPVRLGIIDYLNTQPIEYHLDRYMPGVQMLRGVPTAINRALLDGDVALAPISAYAYAQHTDTLLLVPGLSIAALGKVNSVLLFSWYSDLRELDGMPVALSDHSQSSIHLLRVLCEHFYQVSPRWCSMPQDLDSMLTTCEAALLIGNHALIEGVRRRPVGQRGVPYCFDLGGEWLSKTGLPFTFAVWGVRRDSVEAVRAAHIVPMLHASKADGLHSIDDIAQVYAPRLGLSADVCADYLRGLRYHLDEQDREGLRTFLRLALPGGGVASSRADGILRGTISYHS